MVCFSLVSKGWTISKANYLKVSSILPKKQTENCYPGEENHKLLSRLSEPLFCLSYGYFQFSIFNVLGFFNAFLLGPLIKGKQISIGWLVTCYCMEIVKIICNYLKLTKEQYICRHHKWHKSLIQ